MSQRISVLKRIIEKNNMADYCSFENDTPTEERLCIRNNGDKWVIFSVEKGRVFDEDAYDSEDEACLEFLKEMFNESEKRKAAISDYYTTLLETTDEQLKSSTMRDLIAKVSSMVAML